MKKSVFVILLAGLLSGCWILPGGDPPPGNIVRNPGSQKKFTKPSEAFDYMVSSMTAILLEKCPGERLSVSVNNAKCRDLTAAILRESSKISGNRFSGQPEKWNLRSAIEGENIRFSLYHQGKMVWEEVIYSPF